MRASMRSLVGTGLFALALSIGQTAPAAVGGAGPIGSNDLDLAIEDREAFGLPSDDAFVAALLISGNDVGTANWGIPMTASEAALVDLPARADFSIDAHEALIPAVESSPEFAGVYFDQRSEGGLVILLTAPDPDVDEAVERWRPQNSRGIEVRYVTTSLPTLLEAMEEAWAIWPSLAPDLVMLTSAVDIERNRVRVEVDVPEGTNLEGYAVALERALGVQATVDSGRRSDLDATACSPTNCHDPHKAGIQIYHDTAVYGREYCTMGFHVLRNGDEQFLTAGHCNFHDGGAWAHYSWFLGTAQATLYVASGKDAMRIQMPDDQVSDDVHMLSTNLGSGRNPAEGEPICAYKGVTQATDCGTVNDAFVSWHDNLGGFLIFGASAAGITVAQGDSGGPIIVDGVISDVAVGLLNTASGKFARLGDVMAGLGVTLYTLP